MKLFWSLFFFLFIVSAIAQNAELKLSDSIFFEYKSQLDKALEGGDGTKIAEKYIQLGDYYHSVEINTQAIEQYNQALSVLNNEFPQLEVRIKNKIGLSYINLKNYLKSREYLNESIRISEEKKWKEQLALAESLVGTTYEKQGNYLKALEHQNKSLKLYTEAKDRLGIAIVNENIGSVYEDLEQFENALEFFTISNTIFSELNHKGRINVLNNLGDVYRKTGDYEKAMIFTNRALKLAELFEDHHQLESAHKDLARTYALMGEYQSAYEHRLIYEQLQEEGFYAQNFRQLNALQTIFDTRQKESEIALLKQENKVSEANQHILILGVFLFIFLSGISFFFYNRKRKESAKLQAYEQKLLKVELDRKAIEEKKLQDEIRLKTASLSKYSLNMAQKNKMIAETSSTLQNLASRSSIDPVPKIKSLAKELDKSLSEEQEWDEFMNFFQEIHPQFIKQLSKRATAKLSSTELRLAMLLRLNLSSKEIAAILRVTPDSVRVARYRLRRKLPIAPKQELVNFMLQF
ncbi:tetratricopeptide repeat protein [Zunongwangia pacifica]|uniref:Tetratricopeptide repeat protein n=1 Tax=Zunongwangia pacifica TaxID=2911062 RepID=A0A9X2CLT2_9FLAO|nr:tetratricopeptide repeat protein [Zunongwangia pacifica]MCL6218820.1 tetratricopeptide repeat protein [Zunongwangia pacifica]